MFVTLYHHVEETDNNAVSYRTNAIRIALDTEKQAMAKIMAV